MTADSGALLGIHHAALICSDYARSKDFYVRILGLRVLAENHRAARDSWKLDLALPDGGQLELFSFPSPPPRPSRPEAQGLRHLAFRVATRNARWRRPWASGRLGRGGGEGKENSSSWPPSGRARSSFQESRAARWFSASTRRPRMRT